MTTKVTELSAQLTADASGLSAAFQKAQREARDLGKASQDASRAAAVANQRVADSFDITADKARKAASGVTGVSQALFALQAEGSSRVLALGSAVGNVAELFGPTGALVTGIGVAASAIAALFLQAREEAKRTAIEVQNEIRALASSKDLGGLSRRQAQLFSGDQLFPLAANDAAPDDKRRARGIGELGGILGLEPKIRAAREEVKKLEEAFRAVNSATAAVGAPGTGGAIVGGDQIRKSRAALEELLATQRLLKAEYDETTRRVQELTPRIVSQTQTSIDLASATKQAAASEREATQATAARREEAERSAKFLQDELLRSAGRAIDVAQREIGGLLDQQEKLRKNAEEAEKAERKLAVTRKENVEQLRDELEAAEKGQKQYQEFLKAREREAFIQAALNESRELAAKKQQQFTDKQATEVRRRAGEAFDLRQQIDGLVDAFGRGDQQVESLAEGLSKAASAAAGIALAFGESGRQISALLGQTSQLLTNLSRAKKAGIFTDGEGKQQDVGFLGALSGKAGVGGVASAASAALGVVGAVGAVASALDAFGSRARQRAKEIAEATKAFNEGFAGFKSRALGEESNLDDPIKKQLEEYAALLDLIRKRFGGERSAEAQREIARVGSLLDAAQERLAGDFFKSLDDSINSLTGRQDLVELAQAQAKFQENQNALLALERARIITGEEYAAATEKNKRILELTTKAIEDATKAEAARLLQQRQSFEGDLTAREQALAGNDRGALETRQQLGAASALQQAQELLNAGTITAEMFERLARILDGELAEALKDFDEAAAAAAQRVQDDIAVRTLVAQGRTEEADALRREIANREELRTVTDETVRAQIEQLQVLEAQALAVAEALQEEARQRESARDTARTRISLFDLEGENAFRETLAGYGQAFSDLLSTFDLSTLDGITGAKEQLRAIFTELTGLTDGEILQRFGMTRDEVIAALLDTDSGLEGLASSLSGVADAALEAAQATADFVESLQSDYLRSQGRGLEADERAAAAKRDARIKQARQLGLGADAIAQIEAIYQADLAEIRARYAPAAAAVSSAARGDSAEPRSFGGGASSATRENRGGVRQEFGALAEVTGQTLAGLLREVAINTGSSGPIVAALLGRASVVPSLDSLRFAPYQPAGAAGGIIINVGGISIGALDPGGLTPAAAGERLATEFSGRLSGELGRQIGKMVLAEARYLGSKLL